MDKKITASIVIPNWNGIHLLKKHLKTVIAAAPEAQIIVSDDLSSDGSLEYIRDYFPNVLVVASAKHQGFAGTVNAGVAGATGDIVFLLNTDVVPEKGFLEPLLTHFKDPNVFAVGCLEKSVEQGKTVLRGRGLAHWVKGYYIHTRGDTDKANTAWVSGGSGAFRKTMWDRLGGMDTLYNPFYWEDIDLSYRARKAGWKTVFEPKSVVNHYHEEGKIRNEFTFGNINQTAYRNQYIFIWKNTTDANILLDHIVWTPIRLLQAVMRGDIQMLQGYILALQKLREIFLHRFRYSSLYKKRDTDLAEWEEYKL